MDKIKEAQEILKDLGLPEAQQNKISAMTLLALANIKPTDSWLNATNKSMTLSKDIIEFVNTYYNAGYKPNTRESFRKIALKPFIEHEIVSLNPDNPNLSPTSSKTHYALTERTLQIVKNKRGEESPSQFKTLLREIKISNYKSISEDKIELGRFNVFIGVNGCGKTNILEALATIGASIVNDLNFEGLYSRGVRIARPNLTISSFLGTPQTERINIDLKFENSNEGDFEHYSASLHPENRNDIYTNWINSNSIIEESKISEILKDVLLEIHRENKGSKEADELIDIVNYKLKNRGFELKKATFQSFLSEYAIFDLNTRSLRGVVPVDSRKTPLGINGEGLDLLIANFSDSEKKYLEECQVLFNWLDSIYSDKDDKAKLEGLKPGRSSSTLYFTDRFMQKKNNIFSAENSNEGILHILFYIALFVSNKTPNFFAIDNIETALNPRLCQKLIKMLVKLSADRGKQTLITTHNPAVLDGLNLFDDEQRLFEVYRDSQGRTKTRRIKFKQDLSDKKFKLSEMWLKGLLGAVPTNF